MSLKSWPKWFQASVQKHFKAVADANSIPIFFEGEDKLDDPNAYVECRAHGPDVHNISKDCYRVDMIVNIVITVGRTQKNAFLLQEIGGMFQDACIPCILIYKLGNQVEDDKSVFTKLPLRSDLSESMGVKFRHLGRVGTSTDLIQGIVNATYRISTLSQGT